jgi:hypothetical protein
MPPSGAAERQLPGAAAVLRRALLGWGLGHLALGDRRGWALLAAEVAAISAWLIAAVQLIQGSGWLALFLALLGLLLVHAGQAVHAQRMALRLGAAPGGELQMAWLLPVVTLVVAGFWLLAGNRGSPEATLAGYVAAWQADHVEAGQALLVPCTGVVDSCGAVPARLSADWHAQGSYIADRVAFAAQTYGPASGLDPSMPFNGLRFSLVSPCTAGQSADDEACAAVDIVRFQRIETTLFGFIPTASREIVVVERLGTINLTTVRGQPVLSLSGAPWIELPSREWRIASVSGFGQLDR